MAVGRIFQVRQISHDTGALAELKNMALLALACTPFENCRKARMGVTALFIFS